MKIMHIVTVGMNDKDTKKQALSTPEFLTALNIVLKTAKIGGYSYTVINGGYTHEDGTFISENSVKIEIFGEKSATIKDLIASLKTVFNQETVMHEKRLTFVRFE